MALPVETCTLNGSCTDGERIYYLTETRAEGARDFHLCRASLSEGTAEPLEQYQSPSMRESFRIPLPCRCWAGWDAVAVGGVSVSHYESAGGL